MRRFLIDTDTASDDAVAPVMVARAPDVQIEAVTVVAGNVPLAQGFRTRSTCSNLPVVTRRFTPALQEWIAPCKSERS
jgi:inosine-uridine nucleoside N-ribohydrolase